MTAKPMLPAPPVALAIASASECASSVTLPGVPLVVLTMTVLFVTAPVLRFSPR